VQKRKDPVTTTNPFEAGIHYNEQKMRQVILFFVHHVGTERLGKTKLMKLLYFADFNYFEKFDESITGAEYRRLRLGPVPTESMPLPEAMALDGDLEITRTHWGEERYTPLRDFDASLFSEDELQVLREVAVQWRDTPTKEIVAASHADPPWNAVANSEIIPYYLVHYRNNYGELDLDDDELNPPVELTAEGLGLPAIRR